MRFAQRWLAVLLLPSLAMAAGTATWEMSSYDDFIQGRFRDIALDRDGNLRLSRKLDTLFSSDQPAIWTIARTSDGTMYLGTGHRGRIFRVEPNGTHSLYWQADSPEVFALAVDSHARRQDLPDRQRQGYGVLQSKTEIHLVACFR